MKLIRGKSMFFGILAGLLMVLSVAMSFFCRQQLPVLLTPSEDAARERVQALMSAVCSGEYEAAGQNIYGGADLGMEGQSGSVVNRLLWDAYLDSLDYEMVGMLYVTEAGVAQDVKLSSLDLAETTKCMGIRAQELLTVAVEQAEDVSQVYDRNNGYQEAFVEAVIEQAARETLEEDARYIQQIVPVQLKYSDGQWWIVADEALTSALSGISAG